MIAARAGRLTRMTVVVLLLAAVIHLALPATAWAAEPQVGSAVTGYGLTDWLGLFARLGLVLAAIWGAVAAMKWYVRRVNGDVGGLGRQLQVLETRPLGPNRSLQLVRLGGRAVLLGVTAERITSLLTIEDAEEVEAIVSSSAQARERRFAGVAGGIASGLGGFALQLTGAARSRLASRKAAGQAAPRARAASPFAQAIGARLRGWISLTPRDPRLAGPRGPRAAARSMPALGPMGATRARAASVYGREGAVAAAQRAITAARGESA